jgi:hypothetical protein
MFMSSDNSRERNQSRSKARDWLFYYRNLGASEQKRASELFQIRDTIQLGFVAGEAQTQRERERQIPPTSTKLVEGWGSQIWPNKPKKKKNEWVDKRCVVDAKRQQRSVWLSSMGKIWRVGVWADRERGHIARAPARERERETRDERAREEEEVAVF